MKIFMTGGTGFVGTTLTEKLTQEKHQVSILTRALRENRALPGPHTWKEIPPKRGHGRKV
jgi:NAD dependent epimerase/dehydratase family enzyme